MSSSRKTITYARRFRKNGALDALGTATTKEMSSTIEKTSDSGRYITRSEMTRHMSSHLNSVSTVPAQSMESGPRISSVKVDKKFPKSVCTSSRNDKENIVPPPTKHHVYQVSPSALRPKKMRRGSEIRKTVFRPTGPLTSTPPSAAAQDTSWDPTTGRDFLEDELTLFISGGMSEEILLSDTIGMHTLDHGKQRLETHQTIACTKKENLDTGGIEDKITGINSFPVNPGERWFQDQLSTRAKDGNVIQGGMILVAPDMAKGERKGKGTAAQGSMISLASPTVPKNTKPSASSDVPAKRYEERDGVCSCCSSDDELLLRSHHHHPDSEANDLERDVVTRSGPPVKNRLVRRKPKDSRRLAQKEDIDGDIERDELDFLGTNGAT